MIWGLKKLYVLFLEMQDKAKSKTEPEDASDDEDSLSSQSLLQKYMAKSTK